MNRVFIIHVGDEQLTPGKLRELFKEKYPNEPGTPMFTRRAYFEERHADLALKTLREGYPLLADQFHLVEYIELIDISRGIAADLEEIAQKEAEAYHRIKDEIVKG